MNEVTTAPCRNLRIHFPYCSTIKPTPGAPAPPTHQSHVRRAPASRAGHAPDSAGIENENVAPEPSFGAAQRRPRWRSTMVRLMNKAMLLLLVVYIGSN